MLSATKVQSASCTWADGTPTVALLRDPPEMLMIVDATVIWLDVAPAAVPVGQWAPLPAAVVPLAPAAAAVVVAAPLVAGELEWLPEEEQPTTANIAATGTTSDRTTFRPSPDLRGGDWFTRALLAWIGPPRCAGGRGFRCRSGRWRRRRCRDSSRSQQGRCGPAPVCPRRLL